MVDVLDGSDTELGLRERKKLETRQSLVRAALELFSDARRRRDHRRGHR